MHRNFDSKSTLVSSLHDLQVFTTHLDQRKNGQAVQVRFKMAARSVEFWLSLERNFSGIGCTLEAKTTVSNST